MTTADSHVHTLRQRVLDAFHFQETTPLPYTLPVEPEVAERLDAYFHNKDWRDQIKDHIAIVRLPSLSVNEDVKPSYRDPFGSVWRTDQPPYSLETPVLQEPDFTGYRWPRISRLWDDKVIQQQIDAARQRGQFVVVSIGFGIFERSWALRGYENALSDILLHPDFYDALLDGILEVLLALVERVAPLPVEGILLSDDWGGQEGVIMGAKHWRRFIKPRTRQFFEAVHNAGKWTFQHCWGDVTEIIPEMIEIGLDVFASLQPETMDIYDIKRRFGRDLRLWGGLGTQRLLPHGKAGEIRAEIQRLRKEMGRGGGYILAPARPLMREVPVENAVAVIQEFTGMNEENKT